MKTIQSAAGHSGGAGRSRLVIHPDDLQEVAEGMFQAAALVSITHAEPGNLPLFDHLSSIARKKGFQHADLILSLIQRPDHAACDKVLALVRDAITCMGGPGDFFDALDLISAPEAGSMQ
jgi:hypothetical protein